MIWRQPPKSRLHHQSKCGNVWWLPSFEIRIWNVGGWSATNNVTDWTYCLIHRNDALLYNLIVIYLLSLLSFLYSCVCVCVCVCYSVMLLWVPINGSIFAVAVAVGTVLAKGTVDPQWKLHCSQIIIWRLVPHSWALLTLHSRKKMTSSGGISLKFNFFPFPLRKRTINFKRIFQLIRTDWFIHRRVAMSFCRNILKKLKRFTIWSQDQTMSTFSHSQNAVNEFFLQFLDSIFFVINDICMTYY